MSYDDIGLNSQLLSKDSLAAGTRAYNDAITFDTATDLPTNYIGSANIRNFSFSQGQGGTLALGGTSNGDGVMVVNNASGTAVVTLNNAGITVNNGSLSIYNSSGSLTFDSSGLVSFSNFRSEVINDNNSVNTIVGTAHTPLTNGTSQSFVLSRSTNVYMYAYIISADNHYFDSYSYVAGGYLYITDGTSDYISMPADGGKCEPYFDGSGAATAVGVGYISNHYSHIATLPAGTYTLVAKASEDYGGTMYITGLNYGYLILGQ